MKNEIEYIYPATSLQQGFIYHALSHPDDDAYRIQVLMDYQEKLDVSLYIKAWEYCIAQYPILRTAFNWEEDIIQIIYKQGKLDYQLHDVSQIISQQKRDEAIEAIQDQDRRQGFDFSNPTLFRLHIIKQASNYYSVLKTEHHSISDGWSETILLSTLHHYYKALRNKKKITIKEDTAYPQAQEYINKHKNTIKEYWKTALGETESANDINPLLSKPIDLSSYKQIIKPSSSHIKISDKLYDQAKALVNKEGITINVIVQFLWHKLLHTYSNSLKSIVGTNVSGRDLPIDGIEESVGLYINTLPLLIDWENDNSILSQLHQIQQKITELNTNGFIDLAKLQKGGERIFHSLFIYENYPASKEEDSDTKVNIKNAIEKVNYPLSVAAYEEANSLIIKLDYDNDYLTTDKALHHLAVLKNILHQVVGNPDKLQNQIGLLAEDEYDKLIYDWNSTDKEFPKDKTIYQLFEEQTAKTPDNIAVVYEGKELTYKELNEKSNQLAHHIQSEYKERMNGLLMPDTLIAICLDRSLEMLVGILAVLKAGAAYIPIDTEYPQERIDYILKDTQAAFILTQKNILKGIKLPREKILSIDLSEELYKTKNKSNLLQNSTSDDLAYIIYTSGSTGKPKGAMIEHKGMLNHLFAKINLLDLTSESIVAQNASQCFDISVWQFMAALLCGGKVVIYSADLVFDPQRLINRLEKDGTTILEVVPSYLSAVLDILEKNNGIGFKSINYLLVTGEELKTELVKRWFEIFPAKALVNAYGPTEASDDITHHVMNRYQESKFIPIGKPVQNLKIYIVNNFMQLCPIGVMGEICVSGIGVGRGYIKNIVKTKEVFMDDPFSKEEGIRLYKTGDVGKWLQDGTIQYVGRKDDQVKIRGHRIELGEIEYAITQIEGVKSACVLAKERVSDSGKNKYLVGYYVLNDQEEMLASDIIQDKLSKVLPDYMIPSALIVMDSFPLTINGKLDKKALPEAEFGSSELEYVAPGTEIEVTLCRIWQEILDLDKVGITDNFFRIGGDSILSIQVASRIRQEGFNCQVKDMFEYKTIIKLAEHLNKKRTEIITKTEQGKLIGELSFLPIQEWFIEKVNNKELAVPDFFNQSFLVKVPTLEIKKLEKIISELVSYHDVFRICNRKEQDIHTGEVQWKQFYQSQIELPELKVLDVSKHNETEIHAILTNWQSAFNLEQGPLFQAGYLYGYEDGSARIYFALHHMVTDVVSWRILSEDIKSLYEGKVLPPKTSSYRQWASSVKNYAEQYPAEIKYWAEKLKGMSNYRTEEYHEENIEFFELEELLTKSLLQEVSKAYNTEVNDLLLTGLAYALKEINQNSIQGITLEGHGREDIDPSIDHSHTVGWFTTMFPVKLEVKNNIKETIECIKESLRSIPNKGIGFGVFAAKKTGFTFNDLPPISFNYLGQFDAKQRDWQVVSEDSGNMAHPANINHNLININGMISNGKLEFSVMTRLGKYVTKQLNDSLKTYLVKIIKHCIDKISREGNSYTPSDFFHVEHEGDLVNLPLIKNTTRMYDPFLMTDIQKAYLLGRLDAFEIGGVSNHTYNEYKFASPLNIPKLEEIINLLINLYPELRTVFDSEALMQRYLPVSEIEPYKISVDTYNSRFHKDLIMPKRKTLSHHVYDASQYPLFTFHISRFEDCDIMHFSIDLILLDAESRQNLFSEINKLYQGDASSIVPARLNFKDYQDYITLLKYSKWYNNDKSYWDDKLKKLPLRPELLLKCDPKSISKPRFNTSNRIVKEIVWKKFKSKSDNNGISSSAALLSLFGYVLSKYSATKDFLITLTVFNRLSIHPDVNTIWGDFTSTNLFGYMNIKGSAKNKLLQTHQDLWNDLSHGLFNGIEVLREVQRVHQLDPYQAVSPIVFTGKVGGDNDKMDKNNGTEYFLDKSEDNAAGIWIAQTSQAWIDLQAFEADNEFHSTWMYVEQLFDKELIEKLNEDYCNLIEYLSEADWENPFPEISLSKLDLEVIERANHYQQTQVSSTLVDICLAGINSNSERVAIIDIKGTFTYKKIGEYSYNIACYLHAHRLSKVNHLIGVLSNKGYQQVVSTLGIMQSGAAYLPLHVDWPIGRIDEVLAEGGVQTILITEDVFKNSINGSEILSKYKWVIVEEIVKYQSDKKVDKLPKINLHDIAYVIFTSGSTGKPKGVIIDHKGAVNTILAVNSRFQVSKEDKVLALSELSFDLSVYDIFGLLAVGGTIVFPDSENSKQPEHWYQLIKEHNITIWNTVPQLMQLLVDYVNDSNKKLNGIRAVLMSGDWIPVKLPDEIKLLNKNITVMSLGGATEGSIWSVWYEIKETNSAWVSIPYGEAMPNQKMYILNEFGEHCPIGVRGDICIGGDGVALGYWNDKEKTNNSFIQHNNLGKLYKTGDFGKWNRAGYMEFEGRKDNQVKLNGYRVELDEISSKLNEISGIDKSVVAIQNNQLVAYLIEDNIQTSITKKVQESTVSKLLNKSELNIINNNSEVNSGDIKQTHDLNKLYEFAILKLFNDLQIFTKSDSQYSASTIIQKTKILSRYEKFIYRALINLSDSGYIIKLKEGKDQFYNHLPLPLPDENFVNNLKLPEELQLVIYNALHLKEILIEDLSAEIYDESFSTDAYKEGLKHERLFIEKVFKQICKSRKTPINVLEVGAGTGSLADIIINNMNDDDKYLFTDISRHFFVDIKNKYPNKHNLICELYNLDEDPYNQEVGKYQYDVIIAHGVLHDVKNIYQTMDYISKIIKPEGIIIIIEPTIFYKYVDISHGFITGFESFNDHHLRPLHPYLNVMQWDNVLCAKNFEKVIVLEDGDVMTGLYSFRNTKKYLLDIELLREQINELLPEYMRPQQYIKLKELPLTANGKIDFKKLPVPEILQNEYIAPTTELEIEICKIWQDTMGIDKIGVTDNFFKIGGNSILAIRVSHRMSKVLENDVKVADLFKNPTIYKLISKLRNKTEYEEGKL